jgi:hypothetical protein
VVRAVTSTSVWLAVEFGSLSGDVALTASRSSVRREEAVALLATNRAAGGVAVPQC